MSTLTGTLLNHAARLNVQSRVPFRPPTAIASFTFDDFPTSAYLVGGKLLEERNARATYFPAGKYLGQCVEGIDHYDADLLRHIHQSGHEIGCHTFDHEYLSQMGADFALKSCQKNLACLREILGPDFHMTSFAYPYGDVSPKVKQVMSRQFSLCRGVRQRLNTDQCDLAQIKIVSLESRHWNEQFIAETIRMAKAQQSWLVFLSHDVSPKPTPYGSTEAMIRFTLDALSESAIPIMTMKAAAAYGIFHRA